MDEQRLWELEWTLEGEAVRNGIERYDDQVAAGPLFAKPALHLLQTVAQKTADALWAAATAEALVKGKPGRPTGFARAVWPFIEQLPRWAPDSNASGPQAVGILTARVMLGLLLSGYEDDAGNPIPLTRHTAASALAHAFEQQAPVAALRGSDADGDREIWLGTDEEVAGFLAIGGASGLAVLSDEDRRRAWRTIHDEQRAFAAEHGKWRSWSEKVRITWAATMVDLLADTKELIEVRTALVKKKKAGHGTVEHIHMRDEVSQWLADFHNNLRGLRPLREPMLCQPLDWVPTRLVPPAHATAVAHAFDMAGYGMFGALPGEAVALDATDEDLAGMSAAERSAYRDKHAAPRPFLVELPGEDGGRLRPELRTSFTRQRAAIEGERHKLAAPHCDAINKLQKIAWRINPQILAAALDEKPAPLNGLSGDELKRAATKRALRRRELEVADAWSGVSLYLPHTIGANGRIYPDTECLSWVGDDLVRGILVFADKRPLGVEGMRWLTWHVATTFGGDVSKQSHEDRVVWAVLNEELIREAVTKRQAPEDAKDKWQFLAAAHEWVSALDSGDPEAFESSLPVSLDAKNSGLQILAIMNRCPEEARLVGLTDVGPIDLYSIVAADASERIRELVARPADQLIDDLVTGRDPRLAKLVTKELHNQVESGSAEAKEAVCKRIALLSKYPTISREVAKQPVMTLAYGSTDDGRTQQIVGALRKEARRKGLEPSPDLWVEAYMLAKTIHASTGKFIPKILARLEWLVKVASQHTVVAHVKRLRKETGLSAKKCEAIIRKLVKARIAAHGTVSEELLQDWVAYVQAAMPKAMLADCGLVVSRHMDAGRTSWTSPTGLLVRDEPTVAKSTVAYWYQPPRIAIPTADGPKLRPGKPRRIYMASQTDRFPDRDALVDAFAPGFVHSIDASVACLGVLATDGPVALVHDSFGVHAGAVGDLAQTLRATLFKVSQRIPGMLDEIAQRAGVEPMETGNWSPAEMLSASYAFD